MGLSFRLENLAEFITFFLKTKTFVPSLQYMVSVKVRNYVELFRSQQTLKLSPLCSRTLPLVGKGHTYDENM